MVPSCACCEDKTRGGEGSASRAEKFVDLHCHCLAGVDDGPGSMHEACSLCAALARDKVDTVVATPHFLGRFEGQVNAGRVRAGVARLNEKLAEEHIALHVLAGGEIRLDERIGDLLATDAILTLADMKRHLLLELPEDVFIDIEPLVHQLRSQGVDVIIAHPERNAPLRQRYRILEAWVRCGVNLQITAASLTGRFGPDAAQAAWRLVAEGSVAVVASDAHGEDRGEDGPQMLMAFETIGARFGSRIARLLCIDNPRQIVRGKTPMLPVLSGGWEGP